MESLSLGLASVLRRWRKLKPYKPLSWFAWCESVYECDAVLIRNLLTDISEELAAYLEPWMWRQQALPKRRQSKQPHTREGCNLRFVSCCSFNISSFLYDDFPLHPSSHFINPCLCLLLFREPPLVRTDCSRDVIGPLSISVYCIVALCLSHTRPVAPSHSCPWCISFLYRFFCFFSCSVFQHVCVDPVAAVVTANIGVMFGRHVCLQTCSCHVCDVTSGDLIKSVWCEQWIRVL
jgi:hypothetical protein